MRYITDSNNYLQEVSFGADIMCNDKTCTEYTGAVPSGYSSLVDWFCQEGDKLYRWKIVSGQLTLDSSVAVKADPGAMFAPAGYGLGTLNGMVITDCNTATANGFYTLSGDSLQNGPAGTLRYGNMLVLNRYSNNHITQIAYYRNDMAIRTYYSSTWSAWEKFGTRTKLLWTNASPSSAFANQTLTLDLSSYDAVEVEFGYSKDYPNDSVVVRAFIGHTGTAHYFANLNNSAGYMLTILRSFIPYTDSIVIYPCYWKYSNEKANSTHNDYAIPIRIYGIKGVS